MRTVRSGSGADTHAHGETHADPYSDPDADCGAHTERDAKAECDVDSNYDWGHTRDAEVAFFIGHDPGCGTG